MKVRWVDPPGLKNDLLKIPKKVLRALARLTGCAFCTATAPARTLDRPASPGRGFLRPVSGFLRPLRELLRPCRGFLRPCVGFLRPIFSQATVNKYGFCSLNKKNKKNQ